jgi:hypothetical protein
VVFIVLSVSILSQAEYYYVVAYGQASNRYEDREVFLKRIDLDSAKVTDSILVAANGTIASVSPIKLSVDSTEYLIGFVEKGIIAKNTGTGTPQLSYGIVKIDNTLSLVKTDSFIDCLSERLEQYQNDNSFVFGVERMDIRNSIFPVGKYFLNNDLNFVFIEPLKSQYAPGTIEKIGDFEFLIPLGMPNPHNLYYAFKDFGYWAVRLNSTKMKILDSICLELENRANSNFTYHPIRNKFYWFHLNYEEHVGSPEFDKNYGQDWIIPEVLVIDPYNFKSFEKHQIADFDSGSYPYNQRGLATVVGDYIVFYYSDSELREEFNLAPLFIFDTRTNTAKWLNVGWR